MRHFLAYGNSDQASFRAPDVRGSFDYLTVPGTIAAYYPDATAAFVLSSELEYIIDPRTPLFQGRILVPKASHYALAAYHGQKVGDTLGTVERRISVAFSPDLYDKASIADMVSAVIAFQAHYHERAGAVTRQIERYARLLARAKGSVTERARQPGPRPPAFLLAPYFCMGSPGSEWWDINMELWKACASHRLAHQISPVVALQDVSSIHLAFARIPAELSDSVFMWIAGLSERDAPEAILRYLLDAIKTLGAERRIINLYGGFFSICLGKVGLWGFNNGLTYSESRDWPELSATGAAPPRYYVRKLHAFLPVATADLLVEIDDWFACPCAACEGRRITDISYHGLKRHFALARSWERDTVADASLSDVAGQLREARGRYDGVVRRQMPPGVRQPATDYLERWADVLSGS